METRQDMQTWEMLTRREQEIVALVCLGYTYEDIALRFVLSRETVKTHVKHAVLKFGFKDKHELRNRLAGWDFSGWEENLSG